MPLQLINPPAEEPVTLDEAKLHLRVDFNDDDALITSLISAARHAAETITNRQFITARWKLILDSFPGPTLSSALGASSFSLPLNAILIPKSPVLNITSLNYLDMANNWQSMPKEIFTVDSSCEPARITPVFGQIWPIPLPQIGSVNVIFDAGYGTAEDVPEGIKSWIKIRVGSLYAHREEVSSLSRGRIETLPFVDGLLDPYKVSFI